MAIGDRLRLNRELKASVSRGPAQPAAWNGLASIDLAIFSMLSTQGYALHTGLHKSPATTCTQCCSPPSRRHTVAHTLPTVEQPHRIPAAGYRATSGCKSRGYKSYAPRRKATTHCR